MTDINPSNIKLESSWKELLLDEFSKPYMKNLKNFLKNEYSMGKTIFPEKSDYFKALNTTPFSDVKVVIIGQDPYHGPGQAHGLSFSVPIGISLPPSLQNIFKELSEDLKVSPPPNGSLLSWAKQGVLLLNAVLTVERGQPGSHQGKGWEEFTDRIIEELNKKESPIVFVLWGSYAQKKGRLIDKKKHFVIESPHPSPLSAHKGFFGSRPFSKINDWLLRQGKNPILWNH